MKVSDYACLPNAMEISSPLKADVRSTRFILDLSNLFHHASVYRHNFFLNNDNASPLKLLEVVENCLGDLTVREMIEYDENIFPIDLKSIVSQYPHQIPNWQLKMSATRLERLASHIINYALRHAVREIDEFHN